MVSWAADAELLSADPFTGVLGPSVADQAGEPDSRAAPRGAGVQAASADRPPSRSPPEREPSVNFDVGFKKTRINCVLQEEIAAVWAEGLPIFQMLPSEFQRP